MKGGRLRVLNETSYPDDEVKALVEFGLREIDVRRTGLLALVKHARREYSGTFYDYMGNGIPLWAYKRMTRNERFLIVLRIGPPEGFPITPFRRNGIIHDARSWQEALVGIAAHEGLHAEHAYDRAYRERARLASGRRRRIGMQRVEPKCEAFEARMIHRYREEVTT
jgi:hypothetical protein